MTFNILIGHHQMTNEKRSSEIETIPSLITMDCKFKYDIEHLNVSDFYLPEIPSLCRDGHQLF